MGADPDGGLELDPAALAEKVDLDEDRRRVILEAEARADRQDHWEALGLRWNASTEEAKAAYLDRVKVFHPDRYPGKKLGSFRGRLERVFRRLTEARDVLGDEARRAAYARQTAPPEEFARMEAHRLDEERRGAERRARLARRNPIVARAAQLAELIARARQAMAEGRYAQAAADFFTASGIDAQNVELKALAAEAKRKAVAHKAQELYEKAMKAEAIGSWTLAVTAYREALDVDPRHVRAAVQGAKAALQAGDGAAAKELGDAAVRAAPGMGIAHEALGLVLAALGREKEAKRELERALELDPRLEAAKERLKKMRWSLRG
ncbi:MAG TPA: DnaJ domain-containing protein [Anaeromyxobacteraceae bacterium]|nr:DnaJ domain-containing protein [Anaeromyxobacteraceae bacterium]